jgi:hypothetical protein
MIRKILAFLVAGAFALSPAALVHNGPDVTNVAQNAGTAAYDRVATCFAERKHMAVLALVDESSSLRQTDPGGQRAAALVNVLRMLAHRGGFTQEGTAGKIEVQLAGFSTTYAPGAWTTLGNEPGTKLESTARAFRTRKLHDDTDFAAALLGAQKSFMAKDAEATRAGDQPPCRLLLLFTDGRYELGTNGERDYAPGVEPDDRDGIRDQGRRVLCGRGQLVDQLRESGTVVLAIGLAATTPGSSPPNHDFLRSIAERKASGETCGASTTTPGKFIPANGLGELTAAFDKAIALALGGTIVDGDTDLPVCDEARTGDTKCERTFRLDAGLHEFHLLLNLGASGIEVRLRSPAGTELPLRARQQGDHQLAGGTLATSVLGDLDLVIDGTLPAGTTTWVGTWTVRFVDTTGRNAGAIATSQLTVFGGLVPVTRPDRPKFQVGERTSFRIAVVDAAGSPRTPADFVRSAKVTAVLVDPQGKESAVQVGPAKADGTYEARYRMPDDAEATYVILRIQLDVVTSFGLSLQPRTTSYRIPVDQPSAYPTLDPLELFLTPIIGEVDDGEGTRTLTVTGGLGGNGCVWFEQPRFTTVPPNTGQFTATMTPGGGSEADCVQVDARQQVKLTVAVAPDEVRTGFADGQMVVNLKADGERTRQVHIPVRLEMQHPIVPGIKWLIFTLVFGGGLILPLLLLWLVSRLAARFAGPDQLRWVSHEVVVTDTGITVTGSNRQLHDLVTADSLGAMVDVPSGRPRQFQCGELIFTTKVPVQPWALPYAVVSTHGQPVLSSGGEAARDLRKARVGFELNRTWVFAVADEGSTEDTVRFRGTLYLFVTDFELAEKAAQVTYAVERTLPGGVVAAQDRIRSALGTHEQEDAPASEPDDTPYRPRV